MLNKEETLGELIRNSRKEKKISARKLATLIGISHTEINNIENGLRVKPSILVLKGLEKYLDIPFSKSAKIAGYSKETIKFGDAEIIVSYEMYDNKLKDYQTEIRDLNQMIDLKIHIASDTKEIYKDILDYLNKQDNIDESLLKKANDVKKYLTYIEMKFRSNFKDM